MYDHAQASASLLDEIEANAIVIRTFPTPIQPLTPEKNGFLVEAYFEQQIELDLVVVIPKSKVAAGIVVRSFKQDKPVIEKSNQADRTKPSQVSYQIFRKTVKNRMTLDRIMSTKHDVNNIRLVVTENGVFQMWEIAIPTRIQGPTASFFLTIQRLYKATMYNLNGQIYMPEHEYDGFKKWEGLQTLITKMVSIETLLKIDRPLTAPSVPPAINGAHRVLYFCLASGSGMAQTTQGPANIYWKDLPQNEKFACVRENQLLGGEVVATERGLQLKNIVLVS